MKVCTIIISYNFEKWIHKCLPSLQESSLPTTIVVIDNASKDRSCQIIQEQYPEVILFKSTTNLGFGKANNIGFDYALKESFDFLFLLNQDAWIEKDTLKTLVDCALQNETFGILSPIHLTGAGSHPDAGFAQYTGVKNISDIRQLSSGILPCKFINAALWLLPIAVVKKVGGFAPIFSHYGEDVNYAQRVRFHHYQIGFTKEAFGYHDREYRQISRSKFLQAEKIYFTTEATNPLYSFIKALAYSVGAAIKKALRALFGPHPKEFFSYLGMAIYILSKLSAIKRIRLESTTKPKAFL